MFTLCAIAVAAVLHRMFALAHPLTRGPAAAAELDADFTRKAVLTLVHIVAALVFVLLVPLQFSGTLRARHPRVHRWTGRIVMALTPVIGLSALLLLVHPIGGIPEVTAILFFDGLFLFAMGRAFVLARQRRFPQHREWVIRGGRTSSSASRSGSGSQRQWWGQRRGYGGGVLRRRFAEQSFPGLLVAPERLAQVLEDALEVSVFAEAVPGRVLREPGIVFVA